MKKPEKTERAAPENPYLAARREWNERYGDYIKAAHNWRLAAIGSIGVALICSSGMATLALQQKVVPYAVEFNEHHEPVRVTRADVMAHCFARPCKGARISVQFVKENMSFTAGNDDPRSTLMFTMLSVFAQFERSLIKERQREGIALARAKGVYKGRKPALNAEKVAKLREQAAAGANRSKLAKEFGISRETLYSYIRQT